MPKNIEDIIPSEKRSIRSIPVPIRKVKKAEAAPEPIVIERYAPEPREPELPPRRRGNNFSKKNIWIGGILGLAIVALAVFSLRSSATLAYIPKTSPVNFNEDTYVAYQSATNGQLPYSVVKLSGTKSLSVPASGEETVSEMASGKIIVYNQQDVTQRLVKTTRFQTGDGLIFRTPTDLTIPAKGSIEVAVVADQPGATYNVGLSDFTLPGLKGTANFDKVYARSKAPMSGGFTGTRKKVSDADLAKAKSTLEDELKTDLLSQARAQMPADFVLFPDLASLTYTLDPLGTSTDNSATVNESADLSAVIFKRSDLAQYLALQKLGSNKVGSAVEIPDYSRLVVSLAGGAPADLAKVTAIRVSISGAAVIRFITDEQALAADLVGQDKKSVPGILKNYPSIDTASAIIRPFWKSAFPNDATKIKIERQS